MASISALAKQISSAAQELEMSVSNGALPPPRLVEESLPNGNHANGVLNGTPNGTPAEVSSGPNDTKTMRNLPDELEEKRCELEDATHKLQQMTRGPGAMIYEHLYRFTDIASWIFLCKFNVPALIPLDGTISYAELSPRIRVQEPVVRRYVENLMVSGFFEECPGKPGHVRHSPDSRILVSDPKVLETIGMLHDEMLPSLIKSVDALVKWPMSQETNESGFSYANDTTDTMYQVLAKDPKKAQRFGAAMSTFTKESITDVHPLVSGYDWQSLDMQPGGATVVDLGGSIGHLSFHIARATNNIHFEVQDLAPTAEAGKNQCPSDMRERCEFVAHDFLTAQKPRDAPVDAFLIANTLQNWPDKHVVAILRNLIPVMRKGSRVLVYERPLPETADTRWSKRVARTADMLMGSLLNGMLRSAGQWTKLFHEADSRYEFVGVSPVGIDKGLAQAVFDE